MAKKKPVYKGIARKPAAKPNSGIEALALALDGFRLRLIDAEQMNDMLIKRVTVIERLLDIGDTNNA